MVAVSTERPLGHVPVHIVECERVGCERTDVGGNEVSVIEAVVAGDQIRRLRIPGIGCQATQGAIGQVRVVSIISRLGRIAGKSLGELLGGRVRNEVPFYVASGRRDSTPEEEVAYLQRLIDETGATAVKFRVGGRMSRNADAMPGRTKRLIPLARKTLSDEMAIHADANSSYDPTRAIEVGRALEGIGAIYFEEPCPFDHLEETRRVTEALTIPVAGGEQEFSQRRFRWSIENRVVDIVQPDLQYYGGLIRSIRVARMAAVAKMPTTVHISGGFGFVYMLHFASRTPDIGRFQEYKREIDRYRDWFDPPLVVHAGALSVPTGPGVGIVDPGAVLKRCVKVA